MATSIVNADEIEIKATTNILNAALPTVSGTSIRSRYSVHMAIVENIGGQFIVRRLLPNASGTPLTNLMANDTEEFTYRWKSSELIDPANLSAICFVQDLETKDILQTTIAPLPVALVTGVESVMADQIAIYPNPASREFRVELPAFAQQELKLHLIDQVGHRQAAGVIRSGSKAAEVNVENLSEGIYILEIESPNASVVRKKIMVVMKN
jgi:hypothetical protein